MTHQDNDDILRGQNLLARLAIRHEARRRSTDGWSAEQVRATAARIQAAANARSSKIRVEAGAPPLRQAAILGTIPQILDDARARRAAPQLDLSAAAGVGRELWDEPCETWLELPNEIPDARYLAVRIKGESMVPLLHTGDTILVQLDLPVERGRVILVQMPDGGYAAKKTGRLTRTHIELISLNPDFAPVVIPRDERLVIGTVVMLWCSHH